MLCTWFHAFCLDSKFIVLVAMSFNSCAFLDVAVRGMMYYRRALELQAFLDMATEDGTFSRAQTLSPCEGDCVGCVTLVHCNRVNADEQKRSQRSTWSQLQAIADMKFTYVAACQNYGEQKRQSHHNATEILNLMLQYICPGPICWSLNECQIISTLSACWLGEWIAIKISWWIQGKKNMLWTRGASWWQQPICQAILIKCRTMFSGVLLVLCRNPSLRVAYIDEAEERSKDKTQKVYYSVLVKAVNNLDQEIYRIRLPGPVRLGEGKPENQNHAIIFTRGEGLQAIDMNQVKFTSSSRFISALFFFFPCEESGMGTQERQHAPTFFLLFWMGQDNYLEEAFKMRNLLEEFHEPHGVRPPTILGVREHIFTGRWSDL